MEVCVCVFVCDSERMEVVLKGGGFCRCLFKGVCAGWLAYVCW